MRPKAISLLTGLLASACVLGSPSASAQGNPQNTPLNVTVTMKAIHALALQVMDGVGKPKLLIDGNASPHTFSLRPSDARALNDADVVIRIGETVEPFTAKAVRNLPKSVQVVTLEMAPGVTRLPRRTGAAFEGHAGHGHSHGHNHAKGTSMDGHVWLDPVNAKAMVIHIADVLAAKRPDHAATFKANATKATARLDALSAELSAILQPSAAKPFVMFHDSLQYFEKRFGLNAIGAVTADPDTPPSGKRLSDLRKRIARSGAVCVFAEPTFDARVTTVIIEGTPSRVGTVDPEGLTVEGGPDAYDTIMRKVAKGLSGCLAAAS